MSNYEKWLRRLAKAIKQDRFSFKQGERCWYGHKIVVGPLFCSYGKIGYTIEIYQPPMNWLGTVKYDYEMETCKYSGYLHFGYGNKINDQDLFGAVNE